MKKVVGLVIGLVPVSAFAECVPVPECASIGYTETSCEGDSLKCPFDTTKLKCIPCDSSFRYSCDGDNIIGGMGRVCNNKYVTCECEDRTFFINGECVCDTSCKIGNIYYSDNSFSSCVIEGKIAVGVVIYSDSKNCYVTSLNAPVMHWSASRVDIATLNNVTTNEQALSDMNGKINTSKIVDYYGADTDISSNAAVYCYNFAPQELENTKTHWYLPAVGEFYYYYYENRDILNNTFDMLGIEYFANVHWTSTEYNNFGAWHIYTNNGLLAYGANGKTENNMAVSCMLAL